MIFFDASAAAKRYFQETGSDQVNELWSGGELLSSLVILQCELTSALNRKRRERALLRGAYSKIRKQIQDDLAKIQMVPINTELIRLALRLVDSHPLRALDSLYLAGAFGLKQALGDQICLVAADRQLLRAARAEGLRTFNPEHP